MGGMLLKFIAGVVVGWRFVCGGVLLPALSWA
jgi:hypothetical protein